MAWRQALVAMTWLAVAGVGCDGGGPDYVLPHVADPNDIDCFTFDCPIALGAEVDGDAYVATDYSEFAAIASATVEPPTLATITITDHAFTLHALAEGSGVVHIATTYHTTIDQPIRIAAVATTTVELLGIPLAVDPRGPYDVIGTHVLGVAAVHRDASGGRLLGHGLETWTATGADLAEVASIDTYDGALARNLTVTAATASVTAGGTALELASVPPGSTASVVLAADRAMITSGVSVSVRQEYGYDILAYASDGRFIVDPGQASVSVADPGVATAEPNRYRPEVGVTGRAIGHTTMTIHIDGAEAQYDVDVTR
jgi:hypothetical protein